MENGIYPNISHSDYHAMKDRVSNSYLGRLDKCPAMARIEEEETPSMVTGRAFHVLILEGEEAFQREFAIAPECDRRTKAGKDIWGAFAAENIGKAIITKESGDQLYEMANAVVHHPFAVKLLVEGRSEVSVLWTDKGTGIDCRCRPDRIPEGDRGVIVDVKSTTDASEYGFQRSIVNYGYYRQAGMYLSGYNAATEGKGKVDAFPFIAVEKEPPYRVEVYILDDDFLQFGVQEFHRLLRTEAECRRANSWPHYQNAGAQEIQRPAYLGIRSY